MNPKKTLNGIGAAGATIVGASLFPGIGEAVGSGIGAGLAGMVGDRWFGAGKNDPYFVNAGAQGYYQGAQNAFATSAVSDQNAQDDRMFQANVQAGIQRENQRHEHEIDLMDRGFQQRIAEMMLNDKLYRDRVKAIADQAAHHPSVFSRFGEAVYGSDVWKGIGDLGTSLGEALKH